jgi:large subunit ribosomal protein L21
MYAIVEIAGQQFKVEKNQEIFVHRLEGDKGSDVNFNNVLLLDHDGDVTVGSPTVGGIIIKAKILEHLRGDKVIVFHKKRRKGYQKQNGHRQYFSKVLIEDIITGALESEKPLAAKKEKVKKEDAVVEKETVKKPKATPKVTREKATDTEGSIEEPKKKTKKQESTSTEAVKEPEDNTEHKTEDQNKE